MVLVLLVAVGFGAYQAVTEYSADELREMAPVSTVWGLHACLVLAGASLTMVLPPVLRLLGRKRLLSGLALGVAAYVLCGLAPRTNRIFYDEHIYMQVAQTLAHTGRAEYANYARAEYGEFRLYEAWVNKQPHGHPYVLAMAFRIFGVSEEVAHQTVRLATAAVAPLLYFALTFLPGALPRGAPLAGTLAFIGTPLVLWWGRTVSVEPTTAAAAVAVFLAAGLHARFRDPATGSGSVYTGTLLAAAAAFAAYFRPESLLVVPVAALVLLAADRRFLQDRTTWAALGLALVLMMPNLLHLWSVRAEDWGARDGVRFGGSFVAENLRSNLGYFVTGQWYPLVGTIAAIAGFVWFARRNRMLGIAATVWLLLSWGVFVLFYAGGYHYGASSRYAVISAAPVALFAGVGAAALHAALARFRPLIGGLAVAAALNWVATAHFVPGYGRESAEARDDITWVRDAAAVLPSGALVLSADPCVWNVLGCNAGQLATLETMVRTEMNELVRQYPGGVYMHWDYWVNAEPGLAAVWRQLVVDTRATIFRAGSSQDYRFALLRLDTEYARATFGGGAPAGQRLDPVRIAADAANGQPVSGPMGIEP